MRDRPEVALSRFDMADLMLTHYPGQRDEALEHPDLAISEFEDMKMQPSLDRPLAPKMKAESGPVQAFTYPDGLIVREVEVLHLIIAGNSDCEIAK